MIRACAMSKRLTTTQQYAIAKRDNHSAMFIWIGVAYGIRLEVKQLQDLMMVSNNGDHDDNDDGGRRDGGNILNTPRERAVIFSGPRVQTRKKYKSRRYHCHLTSFTYKLKGECFTETKVTRVKHS